MTRTIFFIVMWLLIVVFLLFLYGALKLANEADKEMKKIRSEENIKYYKLKICFFVSF